MKCRLCDREAPTDLCRRHEAAKQAVESAYPSWEEAYGTLSRTDYLEGVKRNPQTGQWAKEVAELLSGEFDAKKSA